MITEDKYEAAHHAFEGLAHEYAALEDITAESTAMSLAGGRLVGIHYMHDRSIEARKSAAGCTASYEFETHLVQHIDLDDKLTDHLTRGSRHPAEGSPGRW